MSAFFFCWRATYFSVFPTCLLCCKSCRWNFYCVVLFIPCTLNTPLPDSKFPLAEIISAKRWHSPLPPQTEPRDIISATEIQIHHDSGKLAQVNVFEHYGSHTFAIQYINDTVKVITLHLKTLYDMLYSYQESIIEQFPDVDSDPSIVWHLPWIAHRLAPSKILTSQYSTASRRLSSVRLVCLWPLFASWKILHTSAFEGAFPMISLVCFWNQRISQRATVPGQYWLGFLTLPTDGGCKALHAGKV